MTLFLAAGGAAAAAVEHASPFEHYNYWLIIVLMMTGLYVVLSRSNMIKTIIGLNLFQVAVIMFYISVGKVEGGTAPIELKPLTAAQVLVEDMRSGAKASDEANLAEAIALTREAAGMLPDGGSVQLSLLGGADTAAQLVAIGSADQRQEAVRSLSHLHESVIVYSHPLPHVLMLTAIVVGIATTSLALALVVRINEAYDTIEEDEILALESRPAAGRVRS